MYDTNEEKLFESKLGKLLLSTSNRSVILLIDVNEQTAYRRKKDIPSIENLKGKRGLYLRLAHDLKIPVLDGEKKSEEIPNSTAATDSQIDAELTSLLKRGTIPIAWEVGGIPEIARDICGEDAIYAM